MLRINCWVPREMARAGTDDIARIVIEVRPRLGAPCTNAVTAAARPITRMIVSSWPAPLRRTRTRVPSALRWQLRIKLCPTASANRSSNGAATAMLSTRAVTSTTRARSPVRLTQSMQNQRHRDRSGSRGSKNPTRCS